MIDIILFLDESTLKLSIIILPTDRPKKILPTTRTTKKTIYLRLINNLIFTAAVKNIGGLIIAQ